ncbi:unnamed protein product [Soboliphyme baturini]|uniref:BTB domain-containing protein n=1 Tax=Soboliphyme baturini TaxID=241478 RepID=A0A183IJ71_9BILA|nr:unnamed protein product [Soboliphyme baturini]
MPKDYQILVSREIGYRKGAVLRMAVEAYTTMEGLKLAWPQLVDSVGDALGFVNATIASVDDGDNNNALSCKRDISTGTPGNYRIYMRILMFLDRKAMDSYLPKLKSYLPSANFGGFNSGTLKLIPATSHMAVKPNDEILTISIGGKRYTLSRSLLTVDQRSKLADWFKPGSSKSYITDKAGHTFLDRDGKTFRHVLNYLRFKKEKIPAVFCLPSKPDELARLCAEATFLQMDELRSFCVSMLKKYNLEEENYITPFVETILKEYDFWNAAKGGKKSASACADEGEYSW